MKQLFKVLGNPSELRDKSAKLDVQQTLEKLQENHFANKGYFNNLDVFKDPENVLKAGVFGADGNVNQVVGPDIEHTKDFLLDWVRNSEGSMAKCMDFAHFCEEFNHTVQWA